jgi:Holliday junction DNA helicase RuvB
MSDIVNLTEKERMALLRILDYEKNTDPVRDWPLGWSWSAVRTHPSVLNGLLLKGLLKERFHSNSYRGLALTHLGYEQAEALSAAVEPELEERSPSPLEIPDDLFEPIEGYSDIKPLVIQAIKSEKPVHMLFTGVPSSAKTMFLLELARLGAPYILGSQSTKAGIADVLFDLEPQVLLVDEIDRIGTKDIAILLSLAETGIVSETKHGKRREVRLKTKIFAASNTLKLPRELISRFMVVHFKAYKRQEFLTVTVNVLRKRESIGEELASYIAERVWELPGRLVDPRQAVRVARLTNTKEKVDELLQILLKYSP